MKPSDFVFNSVYKGALKKGATERAAKDAAVIAVECFNKGRFYGKASKMMEEKISEAVKLSRMQK